MKKRVLQSLAILGLNVVVTGLAGAAFSLWAFRADPVFAAVPAILALPGILLQPWSLLFIFFLPGGFPLAPVWTTAVSIPIFFFLDHKGVLNPAKRALARLKNWRTVGIAGAAVFCLMVVGAARYVDFPSLYRGIPETRNRAFTEMKLDLGAPRYYCLGRFIDAEWLWQARLSKQDLNTLAGNLGLRPIPPGEVGQRYLEMPPWWWRPVVSEETRAWATPGFSMEGRGRDGWHALATWNPEDQLLHMWIRDNF